MADDLNTSVQACLFCLKIETELRHHFKAELIPRIDLLYFGAINILAQLPNTKSR